MHIHITDSETGNNKGSSGGLVHYLEKENRLFDEIKPETFFNGTNNNISATEVRRCLDGNIAKLSKDDAKFFLVNISPSQKEIAHLKATYGEDTKAQFKAFAIKVMDEYAKNFHRPGIDSNRDLLWFAKLENHRYYSHKDNEVKNGTKKRGELKPGEQMHFQIIVGRKDITNRIKLSPMNKSRGLNAEHSKKLGQFDRVAFSGSGEKLFDQTFEFDRKLEESFAYAKTKKHGSLKERLAMREESNRQREQRQSRQNHQQQQEKTYTRGGQRSLFPEKEPSAITYLPAPEPINYLAIALGKTGPDTAPGIGRKKKKKKKGQEQDEELTL
jgi:hypothetical protein